MSRLILFTIFSLLALGSMAQEISNYEKIRSHLESIWSNPKLPYRIKKIKTMDLLQDTSITGGSMTLAEKRNIFQYWTETKESVEINLRARNLLIDLWNNYEAFSIAYKIDQTYKVLNDKVLVGKPLSDEQKRIILHQFYNPSEGIRFKHKFNPEIKKVLTSLWDTESQDISFTRKKYLTRKILKDSIFVGRPLNKEEKEYILNYHLKHYRSGKQKDRQRNLKKIESSKARAKREMQWSKFQQQSAKNVIKYLNRIQEIKENSRDYDFTTNTEKFEYNFVPKSNNKKIRVSTKDGKNKYYDIEFKDGNFPGQKKIEIFDWQTSEYTDIYIKVR